MSSHPFLDRDMDSQVSIIWREAQVDKSALTSIQAFWTQIFLIPKKILQTVKSMCKRFLWKGDAQSIEKFA